MSSLPQSSNSSPLTINLTTSPMSPSSQAVAAPFFAPLGFQQSSQNSQNSQSFLTMQIPQASQATNSNTYYTTPSQQPLQQTQFLQQLQQPLQLQQPVQQTLQQTQFLQQLQQPLQTPPQQVVPRSIELRDYQQPHVQKLMSILNKSFVAADCSEMGLGKTIVGMKIAMERRLPVVVIAPTPARAVWMRELKKYNCPYYNLSLGGKDKDGPVITYESLRGSKKHKPRHGLLDRHDVVDPTTIQKRTKTIFNPTLMLNNMIDAGTLFICDECHKVKNNSDQNKAVQSIISTIYARGGRSRVLMCSGTPMDKPEQVVTFLRCINFIRHRMLYSMTTGTPKMEGIKELNDWALRLNTAKATEFIARRMNPLPRNKQTANKYVADMFLEVIKPDLLSIMIRPKTDKVTKDVKNGYYILDDTNDAIYREGVKSFAATLKYDATTGAIDRTRLKDATKSLVMMQKAKTPAMIRVAKELLMKPDANGHWRKVALFADYMDVIAELKEGLKEFSPLELTGEIAQKKRPEIVEMFQQQNNNHRLLIANPVVGGVSINLHDTNGAFPRHSLIMPGFRINELLQTVGRFDRDGLVGVATVRFFYGQGGADESHIFESLIDKGEFMSLLLSEQKTNGVKFPNDYESECEGGGTYTLADLIGRSDSNETTSNDDDDNDSEDDDDDDSE